MACFSINRVKKLFLFFLVWVLPQCVEAVLVLSPLPRVLRRIPGICWTSRIVYISSAALFVTRCYIAHRLLGLPREGWLAECLPPCVPLPGHAANENAATVLRKPLTPSVRAGQSENKNDAHHTLPTQKAASRIDRCT